MALVAVNLRSYFTKPPGENFGLLAAGVPIALPSTKGSLWNSAREFNARVKTLLLNPKRIVEFMGPLTYVSPTLIDAIYFAAYGTFKNKTARALKERILTRGDKPKRALDITNVGEVTTGEKSNLRTIFFVPILSPNYEQAVGIVTAGGGMNIVILHDCCQINQEAAEEFKRKTISYLEEASGG
jgi:hypothetical protein